MVVVVAAVDGGGGLIACHTITDQVVAACCRLLGLDTWYLGVGGDAILKRWQWCLAAARLEEPTFQP